MAAVIAFPSGQWGASPSEWAHFDMVLGLTTDLLPVVSNPKAVISPQSRMQELGKTPSEYNNRHQVRGLAEWTRESAGPAQIAAWAKEPDYGIALQTRRVRAIDVDITDPDTALRVAKFIEERVGTMPCRQRANSSKFLLAFECGAELTKRRIKCEHGIVELLATGQQFIAVGTHPSGVRYEWAGGLPDAFPVLELAAVDALWQDLQDAFGVEPSTSASASSKPQRLAEAISGDAVAKHLLVSGLVKSAERDGRLHIECPWKADHTSGESVSETTYWPAHTGGYAQGHFKCMHAHCGSRTDADFKAAIGFAEPDQFEDISSQPLPDAAPAEKRAKFARVQTESFMQHLNHTDWFIKGVLPKAELVMLYGESGAGKSFVALDIAMAVCRGEAWRGHHVAPRRVVYVAAEGLWGLGKRVRAYVDYYGIDPGLLHLDFIEDAPNLLLKAEVLQLANAIRAGGPVDLIIVDTLARCMPGGNENSSEDMGAVLAHCKGLHTATHATVMLVHHTGKDATRGARGWSGLRAAVDAEIEVVRAGEQRAVIVGKQKDENDSGEFAFKLHVVELGKDEDGDVVTSCVVQHSHGKGPVAAERRLGVVEKVVLEAIRDGVGLGGDRVAVPEVAERAIGQLPFDAGSGGRDTRRQRVFRSIEKLQKDGFVRVSDGVVGLVGVQKNAD